MEGGRSTKALSTCNSPVERRSMARREVANVSDASSTKRTPLHHAQDVLATTVTSSSNTSSDEVDNRSLHHRVIVSSNRVTHASRELIQDNVTLDTDQKQQAEYHVTLLGEQSYSHQVDKPTTVMAHLPPPLSSQGHDGAEDADRVSSSTDDSSNTKSLFTPCKDPEFHAIKRKFGRLVSKEDRSEQKCEEHDTSEAKGTRQALHDMNKLTSAAGKSKRTSKPHKNSSSDDDANGNTSSSGSGTEGGYAGSASSSDNMAQAKCYNSHSESSHDAVRGSNKRSRPASASSLGEGAVRQLLQKKQSETSNSSDIADFSSGPDATVDGKTMLEAFDETASDSPSITSMSGEGSSDEHDFGVGQWPNVSFVSSSNNASSGNPRRKRQKVDETQTSGVRRTVQRGAPAKLKSVHNFDGPTTGSRAPILSLSSDVMAHILTFLEPPETLEVLTMPLSKDWLQVYTRQSELWWVLCLLKPFKSQVDDLDDSGSESQVSFPINMASEARLSFGKYRLLYTSFVRCMRYLARIKDDALHGRSPSFIDFGNSGTALPVSVSANRSLQEFLSRASKTKSTQDDSSSSNQDSVSGNVSDGSNSTSGAVVAVAAATLTSRSDVVGIADDHSSAHRKRAKHQAASRIKRPRFGRSTLTDRLLGVAVDGKSGQKELPWSCAIYSIVNWMVAYSEVEGIQTMCLKVLPFLLENEQQRITAQRAGLTSVVLRGMVMFPNSEELHTNAFHTIVLLARPLGGREGMLFHTSMVNSSGIFSAGEGGPNNGRNGIAVMLDSMKRFVKNEALQAMSCWSLVNIALAPAQKEVLVKLGGVEATYNAMREHPYNAEVQFRALFALINLVIPTASLPANNNSAHQVVVPGVDMSEKEMIDEMADQVIELVVVAMKNFCSSAAVLNRACLVLHNLSLTTDYHRSLLRAPDCYQMLEWCLSNYQSDQVLQQSAAGTLHRLQTTLSNDETLRNRFNNMFQERQRQSLAEAHREAVLMHERQEREARAN